MHIYCIELPVLDLCVHRGHYWQFINLSWEATLKGFLIAGSSVCCLTLVLVHVPKTQLAFVLGETWVGGSNLFLVEFGLQRPTPRTYSRSPHSRARPTFIPIPKNLKIENDTTWLASMVYKKTRKTQENRIRIFLF